MKSLSLDEEKSFRSSGGKEGKGKISPASPFEMTGVLEPATTPEFLEESLASM